MKVKFKTAHGYLSFQPDGRLEYRPTAGAWEEFDIEGLELPAPGPIGQKGAALSGGPVPAQSASYVAQVKDLLLQQGVDLSGPCGAFQITKRVAWGLRGTGAGLLSKPSGNNCDGFAVDIIAFATGSYVDILVDSGGANTPSWSTASDTIDSSRYRPPVNPG